MLERDNVILLVIDFQDALLAKIPVAEPIMDQSVKMIRFAKELAIPIFLSEQYPKGLGRTNERIKNELANVAPIEKVAFGCFGVEEFSEAVAATGRKQLLVVGIEAHVCVMQTVLAGQAAGYEAFVVRDAVGSRAKADYKAGLKRMEANGAQIVTTEMAMFEILRVAGTADFKKILPLIK